MIIKTKTTKTRDGGISEQIISENKPGVKFRKKVTEAYQTKLKPELKQTATEIKTKASKSIQEAAKDLKDMIIRK